jgi:hypothetical protein
MVTINELFFFELGWFLLFFFVMIWAMHRMVQRKVVNVREEKTLKLMSVGFFINEEGFDHNVGMYALVFKANGVNPYHVYSALPWSTIKSLFLSAEIMIIEDIYPYLTLRVHKLTKSQYFVDPLVAPPLPGVLNMTVRVLHKICFWIPKLNDALWRAIKRDPNALTKEVKVIESDIPEEALEYLYRVEYDEEELNQEMEKYIVHEKTAELNMEQIENLTDNEKVALKQVTPVYSVILKEEDEEKTERKLMQPDEIETLKLRRDVHIVQTEPAYEVDYFVRNPEDSGNGIFTKLDAQQMKNDQNLEVKTFSELKTVSYIVNIKGKALNPTMKVLNKEEIEKVKKGKIKNIELKTEILNSDKITAMKADKVNFRVIAVEDGPQFVTFTYIVKKTRRDANLTMNEIEEMKQNPRFKIVNIDEILQSKRVKSFKSNPEEAVNAHIVSCNAIAVQKMKTRQIASEKEKMQRRTQELEEKLYFANAEFAKKETENYEKAMNAFEQLDLILDNVLTKLFKNKLTGMPIDEIKKIAYRDAHLYLAAMSEEQTAKKSAEDITKMEERIKSVEKKQEVSDSKVKLEKELEQEFPGKIEKE